MADITQVKRMLADRAQSVAEMLLPNGRKDGPEWRVGSVNGEKGQSLGVHLHGDKAGIWSDFSTGDTGDLLDLWQAVKDGDLKRAMQIQAVITPLKDAVYGGDGGAGGWLCTTAPCS